ncbi:MAG: Shedu immune nuclease family protein [Ignavibacteriaceae bacterium]
MAQLTTKSTSHYTADILQDFIIDETSTTRRIFKATIVANPKDPSASVTGHIIYQRKGRKDEWEDVRKLNLSELKSGEGVKFHFSCSEMKSFYNALEQSYAIGNKGISYGTKELIVEEASKIIEVPDGRRQFIKTLLKQDYGEEVWKELLSIDPDLATKLSYAKIQADRKKSLKEFEESLEKDNDEAYWQNFFENNQWIFGFGLKYQFLHPLQAQPHYGGTKLSGKGAQKGDYLLHTVAENKFTVPVEIKKPEAQLFARDKDLKIKKYRNGVPILSSSLTGAVSQIQVNSKTWEIEGSNSQQNREELQAAKIFTHGPKGILVIGHSKQLDSFEKRKAFELYRSNIHNPEILLFDELFERAKYIVEGDVQEK